MPPHEYTQSNAKKEKSFRREYSEENAKSHGPPYKFKQRASKTKKQTPLPPRKNQDPKKKGNAARKKKSRKIQSLKVNGGETCIELGGLEKLQTKDGIVLEKTRKGGGTQSRARIQRTLEEKSRGQHLSKKGGPRTAPGAQREKEEEKVGGSKEGGKNEGRPGRLHGNKKKNGSQDGTRMPEERAHY